MSRFSKIFTFTLQLRMNEFAEQQTTGKNYRKEREEREL
jgi:hypothetical protein